jgi:hypothetical protein
MLMDGSEGRQPLFFGSIDRATAENKLLCVCLKLTA